MDLSHERKRQLRQNVDNLVAAVVAVVVAADVVVAVVVVFDAHQTETDSLDKKLRRKMIFKPLTENKRELPPEEDNLNQRCFFSIGSGLPTKEELERIRPEPEAPGLK